MDHPVKSVEPSKQTYRNFKLEALRTIEKYDYSPNQALGSDTQLGNVTSNKKGDLPDVLNELLKKSSWKYSPTEESADEEISQRIGFLEVVNLASKKIANSDFNKFLDVVNNLWNKTGAIINNHGAGGHKNDALSNLTDIVKDSEYAIDVEELSEEDISQEKRDYAQFLIKKLEKRLWKMGVERVADNEDHNDPEAWKYVHSDMLESVNKFIDQFKQDPDYRRRPL